MFYSKIKRFAYLYKQELLKNTYTGWYYLPFLYIFIYDNLNIINHAVRILYNSNEH